MQPKHSKTRCKQSGFTMIEMLIATAIMVIGLVGVAQLVPYAIRLNASNRNDSTALVFAQRELVAMADQPLTSPSFQDLQGVLCAPVGAVCNLGNAATPKVPVGSPVVMLNGRPMIDFTAAAVANYSFNYTDPNDPFGMSYDDCWGNHRKHFRPSRSFSSLFRKPGSVWIRLFVMPMLPAIRHRIIST